MPTLNKSKILKVIKIKDGGVVSEGISGEGGMIDLILMTMFKSYMYIYIKVSVFVGTPCMMSLAEVMKCHNPFRRVRMWI